MMRVAPRGADNKKPRSSKMSAANLDALIEEATVDAYDNSEQTAAFHTMLEDRLKMPFKTEVLGVEVTMEEISFSEDGQIVAMCTRGKSRQRIPILDLPIPKPPPKGSEWLDAYRRWARGK